MRAVHGERKSFIGYWSGDEDEGKERGVSEGRRQEERDGKEKRAGMKGKGENLAP